MTGGAEGEALKAAAQGIKERARVGGDPTLDAILERTGCLAALKSG